MKKSFALTIIGFVTFAFIIIVSCNRKDVSNSIISDNSTKDLLISYLNEQKKVDANSSTFIDTLISKSDWNNITQKTISDEVKLIYLPLTYNKNNIGITFIYTNNTQQIYYSLITEIPIINSTNIIHNTSVDFKRPIDILGGFYNNNMNGYNGSIRTYSLSNNFLWEFGYENGKRKFEKWISSSNDAHLSSGTSQIKSNSISSSTIKANGCLDWYTVTYWDDGTSDWKYIGTTCDGNCLESIGITQDSLRIKSNCNGSGGSAGGYYTYKIISNKIIDPCLKNLISNLSNANRLTNAIGSIMQNAFNLNNGINLTFNEDNTIKNSKGQQDYGQSFQDPNNKNSYNITLNANLLKEFSEERQTLTIMHEVLHDYFKLEYTNSLKISYPNDHTQILNNYIDQMASSLEDLFQNMKGHHDVTLALCYDNLFSSVGNSNINTNLEIRGQGQIVPSDFYNSLISHGLDISTWQDKANKAKGNNSLYGTPSPCSNNSKQN
jgi:hypothetical protein